MGTLNHRSVPDELGLRGRARTLSSGIKPQAVQRAKLSRSQTLRAHTSKPLPLPPPDGSASIDVEDRAYDNVHVSKNCHTDAKVANIHDRLAIVPLGDSQPKSTSNTYWYAQLGLNGERYTEGVAARSRWYA
jgi:hypothetical protein